MKGSGKPAVREIALIGMMVAVIEASKYALGFLPNVELTTFWLIMFTLFFGPRVMLVVPVFLLIEGAVYGFGLWWLMYLYVWPLLVLAVYLFRKQESVWFWAILSGAFGLLFGALCSVTYFLIGAVNGGLWAGLKTAFGWWVAGIMWDIVHGGANFILMLSLYRPIRQVMKKLQGSP